MDYYGVSNVPGTGCTMGKVFISYRRNDRAVLAGRIRKQLEREFGGDHLFIDDNIPYGRNFVEILREEVANCSVLLAVIGPDWLGVLDEHGNRRLDSPDDFVRIEIATALERKIPVIPILVDGATVPKADQMPRGLEELVLRHGLSVGNASFRADMNKLVRGIKGQVAAAKQTASTPRSGLTELSAAEELFDKAFTLGTLGRNEEEIAVYDDLLARFSHATQFELRRLVARALFNKAFTLGTLGRKEEEIAFYDDLLARFSNENLMSVRQLVANALINKGVTLGTLGRNEEEIAVYDDLLARFGSVTELPLRQWVAKALIYKGFRLGTLGRNQEEIAVYDDLLARFGSATELTLREAVANALISKGVRLGALGRNEEAIAVGDGVLTRFAIAPELALREQVAKALVIKASALAALGRGEHALAVCNGVLARFAKAPESTLREQVAKAQALKALFHKS